MISYENYSVGFPDRLVYNFWLTQIFFLVWMNPVASKENCSFVLSYHVIVISVNDFLNLNSKNRLTTKRSFYTIRIIP